MSPSTIVWDIQTGIVIKNIATWDLGMIAFSGDQRTITLFAKLDFYTYDGLSGEQLCDGELLPSSDHHQGAYWAHKDTLRFAVGCETNGKYVIDILELQPTSNPSLPIVESFPLPVPPEDSTFSFSPVSFHASFTSWMEIVIFDVWDSKVLFQTKAAQKPYSSLSAQFSPDGHFFACGTFQNEIYVWENTSVGYTPWGSLRPQLPFHQFLFSPTALSILSWRSDGIQLLHLKDNISSLSHNKIKSHQQGIGHLVACSTSGMHVATTQEKSSIVTVLDVLNATQQSINTNVQAEDIKIVDNTIFVTDGYKLTRWHIGHIGTGGMVLSACGNRRENTGLRAAGGHFKLSNDCSQIAFTFGGSVFLYDIEARRVLGELAADGNYVVDICFSPDGHQLWFIMELGEGTVPMCYCVDLEGTRDPWFTNVNAGYLGDGWSYDSLFRSPHGYRIIGSFSEWVSDSRGNVLWLPLRWRTRNGLSAKWSGNFLALVGGHHPEPIIIEFQPSPGIPHLSPTGPSDISPLPTSSPTTT